MNLLQAEIDEFVRPAEPSLFPELGFEPALSCASAIQKNLSLHQLLDVGVLEWRITGRLLVFELHNEDVPLDDDRPGDRARLEAPEKRPGGPAPRRSHQPDESLSVAPCYT